MTTRPIDDDAMTPAKKDDDLTYLPGFGNELCSEVISGAVPVGRNNPRLAPYHLYTEQLSGTAFTTPRARNRRTWLYRVQPLVMTNNNVSPARVYADHTGKTASSQDEAAANRFLGKCDPASCQTVVDPIRWHPLAAAAAAAAAKRPNKDETTNVIADCDVETQDEVGQDFLDGFSLMACAGEPRNRIQIYQYQFRQTTSSTRTNRCLCNTDGDWLIVPHAGTLFVTTELGRLKVSPREIVVVPRNIVFQLTTTAYNKDGDDVDDDDDSHENDDDSHENDDDCTRTCAGYVLEVDSPTGLELPERGPIGANGLANPRDFLHPTAWCVDKTNYTASSFQIYTKQEEKLFVRTIPHSPFNVVGWHGNHVPYKYDLNRFCAMNSVTYDHPDPSIYTVLTCPSPIAGTALADFCIFPPRMLATDKNTFRPPWFHRNCMSEFMGLIDGSYDAKQGGGFVPGGASLHNLGIPHGPDAATHAKAVNDPCGAPVRLEVGMAFMFETYLPLKVNPSLMHYQRQADYVHCWRGLEDKFTGWDQVPSSKIY